MPRDIWTAIKKNYSEIENIRSDIAAINVAISTLPRTKLNKVYRMLEELKTLVEK